MGLKRPLASAWMPLNRRAWFFGKGLRTEHLLQTAQGRCGVVCRQFDFSLRTVVQQSGQEVWLTCAYCRLVTGTWGESCKG